MRTRKEKQEKAKNRRQLKRWIKQLEHEVHVLTVKNSLTYTFRELGHPKGEIIIPKEEIF